MVKHEFALSLSDKIASMQPVVAGLSAAQSGGHTLLAATFRLNSEDGLRWTKWPVEVTVDGRYEPTFRLALSSGRRAVVNIPLDLTVGMHEIQVADRRFQAQIQK